MLIRIYGITHRILLSILLSVYYTKCPLYGHPWSGKVFSLVVVPYGPHFKKTVFFRVKHYSLLEYVELEFISKVSTTDKVLQFLNFLSPIVLRRTEDGEASTKEKHTIEMERHRHKGRQGAWSKSRKAGKEIKVQRQTRIVGV
jgi:hypothetical protein